MKIVPDTEANQLVDLLAQQLGIQNNGATLVKVVEDLSEGWDD